MTDVHSNGRVTHPDKRTLASAHATQIRLASYLPDDMDGMLAYRTPYPTDDETSAYVRKISGWDRFVRLAAIAALFMAAVLVVRALIEVGSGVLGS
jgi:hypothetical protein